MTVLKLGIMGCLTIISFQDFKSRQVLWPLFPVLGILLFLLHLVLSVNVEVFILHVLLNICLVSLVLLMLYLVTRTLLKKRFIDHSFGLGDLLFFYAMALGFPTLTFTVLFVNALLFSLLLFYAVRKRLSWKTVPLAGTMGLFLATVFAYSLFFDNPPLFVY